MLGAPNTGLHSIRLFDIAIFDVTLTILLGVLLAYYLKINFWICLVILFIVGEFLHYIFCVDTTFIKILKIK
jgi:fatty acid desaturase